jgi:hypothetical protein
MSMATSNLKVTNFVAGSLIYLMLVGNADRGKDSDIHR